MRKKIDYGSRERRLLNIDEVSDYIGQGKTKARAYMDEIGATRTFGKRVLFDKRIIDTALDSIVCR